MGIGALLQSEYTRREKDTTQDFEMKDSDIYGGSDYQKRLSAFKDRESRKQIAKQEKSEVSLAMERAKEC